MIDRSKFRRAEGPHRLDPMEAQSKAAARAAPRLEELRAVVQEYCVEQSNRARGGLRALSGFDFQIRSYLADFVTNLSRDEDYAAAARSSEQRFEAIEDYMRRGERGWVVVQAKRSLTPTIMAKAAVEFARAEQFLADRHWGERLSFEVVASSGNPRDSWEHALSLTPFTKSPRELQQLFKAMLSDGRVLPPRIEENPRRRLIAALWPHVANPFSVEQAAVDLCLRSSQSAASVDQLPEEIAQLFAQAKEQRSARRKPPGTILQPADVEPSGSARSARLIIGQIPRLSHLREGQFLPRPLRVDEALTEVDSLLIDRRGRSESMLDVFWIKGRSGSGKSVLLLQLAQQLVLQGEEFVCWLDSSDQLELLLEKWSETDQKENSAGFVFIDDLYDSHARTRLDLRRLANVIRNQDNNAWPVVVTCGPAQFEDALRYEGQDDAFNIRSWPLPLVGPAEKEKLREWFENRRGRTAQHGPAATENEGLMISLMAEMAAEGNLPEFGHRFRERLEESELDVALQIPLALNRLYIFPPAGWLSDEQRNRLDALNQDQDFTVLSAQSEPEELLRLTHPHLSNAIYHALRDRHISTVVARDLGSAFQLALETCPPVAQEILSTVAAGHERVDEADPRVLAQSFCSVWKNVGQRGAMFDDRAKAWTWAHWAVWAARNADICTELGAEPLSEALKTLKRDEDHPQWSIIWRTMAKAHPKEDELRAGGLDWIAETATGSDIPAGWSQMWQELVDTTKERSELDRLLSLGESWLEGREGRREWSFVWETLVKFGYALPDHMDFSEVLETGWKWLSWPRGQGRVEWPYVWQELVTERDRLPDSVPIDELVQCGRNWVMEEWRQDLRQWPYIWETLLELEDEILPQDQWLELCELGQDWLLEEGRKLEASWPHVWERLVTAAESCSEIKRSERLLRVGWEWLCSRYEQGSSGWPRVWSRLLTIGAELPHEVDWDRLIEEGGQWIEAQNQELGPHSQLVWQGLLQVEPEQTIAKAKKWLRDHEFQLDATFVLRPLLKSPHLNQDDAKTVIRETLGWLSFHDPVPEATFVLKPLLRREDLYEDEAEDAIERSVEWLAEFRAHFEATHVVQPLFVRRELTKEQEKEAVEAGLAWLKHYGPVVDSQYILGPLLAPKREGLGEEETAQLIEVALDWLTLHAKRGPVREARYFLGALLEREELASDQAAQAVNAALAWLSEYHAVPEARYVLKPLLRRLRRFESGGHHVSQTIRWAVTWLQADEAVTWLQAEETARTVEDESIVLCEALEIANVQIDVTDAASSDEGELLAVALEWSERWSGEEDTRYVLRQLLSRSGPRGMAARQVETLALAWLRRFPENEDVDYIYTRLLRREALPDPEWKEVAAIAITDLRQRAYKWNRSYVFQELRRRESLLSEADREWLQRDFEQWERWRREEA